MSAFHSDSKKGLQMGCALQGGIHDAQNLPELSLRSSKPFRGRTPHSLSGRFRLSTSATLARERDKVQ